MVITRAYKIRLYPNKNQMTFFNKSFGCCRVIYNEILYELQNAYKNGTKLNKYDLFKKIKSKYNWMKNSDSQGLSNTYQDLNAAYTNFFNKKAKIPKFKKKKDKNSYRNGMMQKTIKKLIHDKNHIRIPKAGLVEFREDYDFSKLNILKIHNLTIERSKTNKYYCSICCDIEQKEYEHTGEVIGIDLGIKDLVIDSNGNKYQNPKYQAKDEKKIKHLQRLYSKKAKGSKNQEKARLKLAIAHEKLGNKRKDNLHKLTTKLIKENDVICIENLNVKGMTKNHRLAKSIYDASFGTLVSMLKYKAIWHNRQIIEIGRFYPSSKLCYNCGHRMQYMGLEIRNWICPNCGTKHDRDVNAAINVKNEGLRILDNGMERNSKTLDEYSSMPVENPTMDDKFVLQTLKSSDSMNQELLYKDSYPIGEGPVLYDSDRFHENIRTLCIISPENPMGKSYTEEKNSKLRAEFNKYCNDNKFITHKVEGKYGGDETSYMIPNIILSDSIQIAEKFNQESFIYSYRDDNDKFVFCYYEKNSSKEYVCRKTKTRIINQNDADDYFTKLNNFKFQIPFFENLSVLKNELDERFKNKDDIKYRIDRSLDESLTSGSRWRARGMLFVKDYEPPTNAPKQ